MSFKKTAGWAGMLAVAFFILNLVLQGSTPAPEDSVADIRDYIANDVGVHKLGLLFGVLAVVPIVAFFAGFLLPFFKSDRENGEGFGIVVFAGALMFGAAATVLNTAYGTLALRGGDGLNDSTLAAVWDMQQVAAGGGGVALTVFAGGVAMAVFRRHVMADWVGWAATLLAALGALGLITLTNEGNAAMLGYLPFLGFLLFVLAVSVDMVRSTSDA
ncbi:MAG: hypothetical protein OES13_12190 [Acidimicrobiia bacterium]|nr:hypothetical protein [Acidimicrobiia bacterium]